MNLLNELFKQERSRVFEPDPYFPQRVMARLKDQAAPENGLWETILGTTRPVLALALTLVFALIGIHFWAPVQPARGMIESYLTSEVPVGESFLYTDSEATPTHDVLEHVMLLESDQ